MALKDIIGQEKALTVLKSCIVKNRIPHALFFAGDEGIGKKLTAINFAKTINCLKGGVDDLFSIGEEINTGDLTMDQIDACDKCTSCAKIDKGNHPDVFIIGPEGDSGQIKVSAVRQLGESLSYKPFEGKWKIVIVDNADRLNQSAANALLQTLEEPTPQSILILVSSRPDMLLSTIHSRCQRINFTPLPLGIMHTLLEGKFKVPDRDQSMLLGVLSGGRLGYALNANLIKQRDWSFYVLKQMIKGAEEAWEDRDAMEEWFDWAQLWLRDIAVFGATGRTDLLVNQDMKDEIKAISRGTILKDVLKLAREFYNIKRQLYFNLNRQLTLNYTSLLLKKMLGKSNC